MKQIKKLISGGQTGADRAGLDVAIRHGIPCGGWCPQGRKSEDGLIPPHYPLAETPKGSYLQRTEWNVRDTDATVIFTMAPTLSGGSKRTAEFAAKHSKPWIHIHPRCGGYQGAGTVLSQFLKESSPEILNVAGTRASKEPEVWRFTFETLESGRRKFFSVKLASIFRVGRRDSC